MCLKQKVGINTPSLPTFLPISSRNLVERSALKIQGASRAALTQFLVYESWTYFYRKKRMEKALQTMIDNIPEKTGRSLEEWKKILKAWLKDTYEMSV